MKARGTSNLNFNVKDRLYLVKNNENNGRIYLADVIRVSPLTAVVCCYISITELEKCEKDTAKNWYSHYITIKGDLYKFSSKPVFLEKRKYLNLPEEELLIYRNYSQSAKTCIKLLIDKNK